MNKKGLINMENTKNNDYVVKGVSTRIVANSKTTVKIKDNFYSIEASEERTIPGLEDVNMEREWEALYDSLNKVVDEQILTIMNIYGK